MIKNCVCGKVASRPGRGLGGVPVVNCGCGRVLPVNGRRTSKKQRDWMRGINRLVLQNEKLAARIAEGRVETVDDASSPPLEAEASAA
jgi:hypothetical protein